MQNIQTGQRNNGTSLNSNPNSTMQSTQTGQHNNDTNLNGQGNPNAPVRTNSTQSIHPPTNVSTKPPTNDEDDARTSAANQSLCSSFMTGALTMAGLILGYTL